MIQKILCYADVAHCERIQNNLIQNTVINVHEKTYDHGNFIVQYLIATKYFDYTSKEISVRQISFGY